MLKTLAPILLLGLLSSGAASAQGVATADVNVVSVTGTAAKGQFICTVEINNHNDDDSRDTRVIVLLPIQTTSILNMSVTGGRGRCTPGPNQGGFTSYAMCELGQLPQGPTVRRTITIA